MHATFPSSPTPTMYCNQRTAALNTFDCLLIYPSGVPNKLFSVNFSYNYQGKSGAVTVNVNPLGPTSNQATTKATTVGSGRV